MDNLAYQEDPRDEMIGGKIILMSPRPAVNHNLVAGNVFYLFFNYLKGKSCMAFGDGTDLYLTEEDRFVPDGMIVCDRNKIRSDGVHGAPDLIVEVLSPSTMKNDRGRKKDAYEKAGVGEYWIVDPASKALEVYLLQGGQYVLHDAYAIYPDFLLGKMTAEERAAVATEFRCVLFDDLVIRLEDVFRNVF